jgi:AcrR family transcriptional regulator
MSTSKSNDFSAAGLRKGRANQKLRTRRTLLETAAAMIAKGQRPTVTEVADAAEVSRRTAYRYFPTQVKLMTEASLEGLRPSMEAALDAAPLSLLPGLRALERPALDQRRQVGTRNAHEARCTEPEEPRAAAQPHRHRRT